MIIIWKGQSCFQISTNQRKNGSISIVIDPYSNDIGLRVPKLSADILLVTHDHPDHNNIKAVSGPPAQVSRSETWGDKPFVINGPGEYDISGISIQGISAFHDNSQGTERGETTIYVIETEEMRLCHLGDLGQKELAPDQLEAIGDIDILMIPVGGTYTIDAKEALKIMSQIEPKIIIPMHYEIPNLKIKLDNLDSFLKVLGIKSLNPLVKLSIKKKNLSGEEAKVIALEP